MEFKEKNIAQHFFNFYAYLAGFEAVVVHVFRTRSKKWNGEITKVTMKCHKHGKEEQPKITYQQEAVVDKDIGKKRYKETNKCDSKNKLSMCDGCERSW